MGYDSLLIILRQISPFVGSPAVEEWKEQLNGINIELFCVLCLRLR